MRRNKLALFVHIVWATWDRLPLLTPEVERAVHRCVAGEVIELKGEVLALNGMPDHVHLVVRLPATISIADLVKQVKGGSSRFVNESFKPDGLFRWQGSYGAFTVGLSELDRVVEYVKHQKQHHASAELWPEYESAYEEFFDEH
jgi:putative transposase